MKFEVLAAGAALLGTYLLHYSNPHKFNRKLLSYLGKMPNFSLNTKKGTARLNFCSMIPVE